jgi:photosynthetic reaction center H subunit
MSGYSILANIDIAEISMYLFTGFFFGLILYLRNEDRREGYPLEEDTTGRLEPTGGMFWFPEPRTRTSLEGHKFTVPRPDNRDTRKLNLKRTAPWPGAPYEPAGNPFVDGVGPGSFAERAKKPDTLFHGGPKIVPLRASHGFSVLKGETDPTGFTMLGVDKKVAGVITDVWVDQAESMIRYLEVEVAGTDGKRTLIPMTMVEIKRETKSVITDSAAAAQFADAPVLENPNQITLYEEERVVGYFGAGYLYAWPKRTEPLA